MMMMVFGFGSCAVFTQKQKKSQMNLSGPHFHRLQCVDKIDRSIIITKCGAIDHRYLFSRQCDYLIVWTLIEKSMIIITYVINVCAYHYIQCVCVCVICQWMENCWQIDGSAWNVHAYTKTEWESAMIDKSRVIEWSTLNKWMDERFQFYIDKANSINGFARLNSTKNLKS